MTRPQNRLRGARAGATPLDMQIDAGPAFLTDARRGCHAENAHLFFSEDHEGELNHTRRGQDRANQNKARGICRDRCPFTAECARYGLDVGARDGVWGGYVMSSADERRRAADDLGWTPGPKKPTQADLRARRVAATAAQRKHVEDTVRAYWEAGKSDGDIALHLGIAPGHINNIRRQLGLATLYGPGGRRIDHELVGA